MFDISKLSALSIEASLTEWDEIGRQEFLDRHSVHGAFKYVIGRGFGSGALKPTGNGWSSSRLYRAYRFRRDAELAENSNKKKWWKNK